MWRIERWMTQENDKHDLTYCHSGLSSQTCSRKRLLKTNNIMMPPTLHCAFLSLKLLNNFFLKLINHIITLLSCNRYWGVKSILITHFVWMIMELLWYGLYGDFQVIIFYSVISFVMFLVIKIHAMAIFTRIAIKTLFYFLLSCTTR